MAASRDNAEQTGDWISTGGESDLRGKSSIITCHHRRDSVSSVVSALSATNRHERRLSSRSWHFIDYGIGARTRDPLNVSGRSQFTIHTLRSQYTVASHGVSTFLGVPDSSALRKKPRLAQALKKLGITKAGLSPFLCTCIVINCISIGYLSLPWAFANAGTVLSTLGFVLVMGQSYITALYTLEACARAEALANLIPTAAQAKKCFVVLSMILPASTLANLAINNDSLRSPRDTCTDEQRATENPADDHIHDVSIKNDGPTIKEDEVAKNDLPACKEKREKSESNPAWGDDDFIEESIPATQESPTPAANDVLHKIDEKKFELSDLCRIFLGRRICYFFYTTIAFDLYGITWTFATVFASGLSDIFTITENEETNYKIFIVIFAAIVVPVTCIDLHDQVLVQLTFLIARMIMVLLMLSTTAEAWASGAPRFGDQIEAVRDAPTFNAHLLYMTVQIAIFSTAYQFVGPSIADASANKSATKSILGSACLYIFLSTLVLSLVLAMYFGPSNMETSSNLNWGAYHGGTGIVGPDGERVGVVLWARMISGFVVAFPAFDALAIFPLLCLSLGEIFVGVCFKNAIHKKISWKKRTIFRLVGCVPQLFGAAFVGDIGVIANYAGLFTVLSYSVCPCLLAIYSRRAMEEVSLSPATYYQTMFSNELWELTICILAVAFLVYVIVMTAVVESRQP